MLVSDDNIDVLLRIIKHLLEDFEEYLAQGNTLEADLIEHKIHDYEYCLDILEIKHDNISEHIKTLRESG